MSSKKKDKEKLPILLRVSVIYIIIAIVSVLILNQIWYLQFAKGSTWREKANKITYKTEVVKATRGNICDEDGAPIITSVKLYDIAIDTKYLSDSVYNLYVDSLARDLYTYFPKKSYNFYRERLKKGHKKGNRRLILQRNINYEELKIVKEFSMFKLGYMKGGLIAIPKQKRHKIYNEMAKRTLGYVSEKSGDKQSKEKKLIGIEGFYNDYLKGVEGKRHVQKIGGGKYIPVNFDKHLKPRNGMDVITTIDVNVQDAAESSLRKQVEEQEADFGCAIVMEVKTGYIKAIANIGKYKGKYIEDYNYAIGRKMSPGSTFKTATFLAALEDGKISDFNDMYNTTKKGFMRFHNRTLKDDHGCGTISLGKVLEQSSNIGTALLVNKYYKDNPQEYLDRIRKFHLMDKTGIDIYGEPKPLIRTLDSKYWSKVSLTWLSFGYESELTPLQILTFYNAIANGGKMMKPQLVQRIESEGKVIESFDPKVIDEAIASKSNIDSIKVLLENVVKRGTARNLKDAPYTIAGKTGTAIVDPSAKKFPNHRASFAGYFPAEDPQYSIIVVINRPRKGSIYGNRAAGNVFKAIGNKIYAKHINIPPKDNYASDSIKTNPPTYVIGNSQDVANAYESIGYKASKPQSEWIISLPESDTVSFKKRAINPTTIPDFKGMNLKDAVYIAEKMGLKFKIVGKGKITKQSIKPGTKINKSQKITLTLS